jgi:hypothetical protein
MFVGGQGGENQLKKFGGASGNLGIAQRSRLESVSGLTKDPASDSLS